MRVGILIGAGCLAFGVAALGAARPARTVQNARDASPASRRLLDGREWTTKNLSVATADSYCYDDREEHCRRYGRLYTWDAALRACRTLGDGWRLPTNDEWAQMAKFYGGVRDDSADGGAAAFVALITGGSSGFDAVFGGNRDSSGQYARLDAHGIYWTATESGAATAWVYNLGRNGRFLNRHRNLQKEYAFAVRCVRDAPSQRSPG